MKDTTRYRIWLHGQLEAGEINPASPLQVRVGVEEGGTVTRLEVYTDQAGVIGLLVYLHGKGLRILVLECEDAGLALRDGSG